MLRESPPKKVRMPAFGSKLLKLSFWLSAFWCAFWIGVAVLHIGLFVRRIGSGEFTGGLDQVRLVLALAGALYGVYGTVKVRNFFRFIDRAPKKLLSTILIVIFGHLAVLPGGGGMADAAALRTSSDLGIFILAPIVIGVGLFGAGLLNKVQSRRNFAHIAGPTRTAAPLLASAGAPTAYALLQRPPPN